MSPPADPPLLNPEQVRQFHRDGFLILPGFYDCARDIEPIQRGIHALIGIMLSKHLPQKEHAPFQPETFDDGYLELIRLDRAIGSVIYDAIKQIPGFMRLVGHPGHERLLRQLRGTDQPGVAAGGYGIRIDNPGEEKFRANWHQDYLGQLRSLDGLVFWSSLVTLTEDMGPLQIAVGSHKDGIAPVLTRDPDNPEKTGAYALRLHQEKERLSRYEQVRGLVAVGDLIVIDFLNLHASGYNRSNRSRWTTQIRYFNFLEPTGQRISWAGAFAAGNKIGDIHPEAIAD